MKSPHIVLFACRKEIGSDFQIPMRAIKIRKEQPEPRWKLGEKFEFEVQFPIFDFSLSRSNRNRNVFASSQLGTRWTTAVVTTIRGVSSCAWSSNQIRVNRDSQSPSDDEPSICVQMSCGTQQSVSCDKISPMRHHTLSHGTVLSRDRMSHWTSCWVSQDKVGVSWDTRRCLVAVLWDIFLCLMF